MRILMLTQNYPPLIGGIEQHVRNLSIELAARKHDVSVVTLWQEGLREFELDQGVRVHRIRGTIHRAADVLFINPGRCYAPPFPDPELTWALHRIIGREQPQIIHAHNWLVHSFLPIKRWSRAKLVVTLHDYDLLCPKWTLIYRDAVCSGPGFIKCLGCATNQYGLLKAGPIVLSGRAVSIAEQISVDMFLPVSQAVAVGNDLVNKGLPFQVIPNFLSDDKDISQADYERYLAQLPSEDYLLFVGAFGHHKGVDVLLRAYGGLTNAAPLVLIGYETSEYPLKPARNVIILKHWPHGAVMEAWRRSIAGLIPSIWHDPCPTVAIEAMASGRPVIASRMGGLPDLVIDGETGFLIPPGDAVALRRAIERLLLDPELRQRMGRAGKQRVIEFQASTVVPRIELVYEQFI